MTTPAVRRAFGVTIASDLPLPELPRGEGEPEVSVVSGPVAAELEGAVRRGVRFQVAPGALWLQVDGLARYLARGGEEVVVDRAADADDESVRLFLLGPVFAALLHQRGFLPLSASAVATERGAAVFLGLSWAGKSTLAAALERRGYPVLADDLCALSFRDGPPAVCPAFPWLMLWPDALQRLGLDPGALRRVRPGLEKRAVPLGTSFAPKPLPLARLYCLAGSSIVDRVELRSVQGNARVGTLGIHTYGSQFVEGLGDELSYFERLAALAALPLRAVTRPSRRFALDELVDRVEEDLRA